MKWDGRLNETMVEVRLWSALRESGLDVEPQINIPLKGRKLRADIAILNGDEIIGLVEVKQMTPTRGNRTRTRQFAKYSETGLPWRYCDGLEDINATVEWATRLPGAY